MRERKKTGAVIICVKMTGIVRTKMDIYICYCDGSNFFEEALYKLCPNIIVHRDFDGGIILDVSY